MVPGVGAHFRVWAPRSPSVAVCLAPGAKAFGEAEDGDDLVTVELEPEPNGYFSGEVRGARAGMHYKFQLDAGLFPDPASRFQPEGPHGPSQLVDPSAFAWSDRAWTGISGESLVIYELHIGTFTPGRTWRSALERLPDLADLGITLIEVMPVADFAGRFGWGYDGVDLFAPTRLYGSPDDFRAFVNRAHELRLGVILDVVYNHVGPDGNCLKEFSHDYFTDRYPNEWGDALNFDGENSGPVRELFITNAAYWIDEFHLDGLRLDATQQIFDRSSEHIVAAIAKSARTAAAGRPVYIVAENEPQESKHVKPVEQGGCGLDAIWNDDFHHCATVAATGRREAYYSDYRGTPQELISATKYHFLFQGQWYSWQQKRRGSAAVGLPPSRFVSYLQNHDQVANSLRGVRLHQLTSFGRFKALTALLLLGPETPMLFQGQEFGASSPFLFFADHNPELAGLVAEGRRKFLEQFPSIACAECRDALCDPHNEAALEHSTLDWSEREKHRHHVNLHRDLIRLRREDPVFRRRAADGVDGAVLDLEAFVLRFFGEDGDDRLLVVNLGPDLNVRSVAEPLIAPPEGRVWRVRWSSEDPQYGGCGTPSPEGGRRWCIPAHAAVVLAPESLNELQDGQADSTH